MGNGLFLTAAFRLRDACDTALGVGGDYLLALRDVKDAVLEVEAVSLLVLEGKGVVRDVDCDHSASFM